MGLFREQDPFPHRTRLTVHVDGSACSDTVEAEEIAVEALRKHLGVTEEPSEVLSLHWAECAPQYGVGHGSMWRRLDEARRRRLPWLQVAGPGFFGTRALADEIVDARKLADALSRRFARFPDLVENEVEEDAACRYGGGFDTVE